MPSLKVEHALDASWLIALSLAIYGGDPPSERTVSAEEAAVVAARIISNLKLFAEAGSTERSTSAKLPIQDVQEVTARLKRFGIEGHTHQDGTRISLSNLPTLTPHRPSIQCWCIGVDEIRTCYCFAIVPEPSL